MKHSVLNLPAIYSVHAKQPFVFLKACVSTWLAQCEGRTIAICLSREEAEQACRDHAQRAEYFACQAQQVR